MNFQANFNNFENKDTSGALNSFTALLKQKL
jgi:hypothetical protein